jgi:hypothetical protein
MGRRRKRCTWASTESHCQFIQQIQKIANNENNNINLPNILHHADMRSNQLLHKIKIFHETDFWYHCEIQCSTIVRPYNTNNGHQNSPAQVYKESGKVYVHPDVYVPVDDDGSWILPECHSIVRNALTSTESAYIAKRVGMGNAYLSRYISTLARE